ncbi:transglycosylase SLT domain-containing protein [Bdellovibrio sp. BCCA]|uniref:transglycosylase SLT domain-containing protein n=1 Tax=Bdellovibrio sp. BCCA TaxID=3136281 RepID=UPI0030F2412D
MSTVATMIVTISISMGFDPNVALSVAMTESTLNPNAIGTIGEVGLFQLRPEYFAKSCTGISKAYVEQDQQMPSIEEALKFSFSKRTVDPGIDSIIYYKYKKRKTLICGQELFDPETNIRTAIAYLKETQEKFQKHDGDLSYLAAYNLGHSAVKKIKDPSKFPYVVKVSKKYAKLSASKAMSLTAL